MKSENSAKWILFEGFLCIWIPLFLNGFFNPILTENRTWYWIIDLWTHVLLPMLILYLCIWDYKIISFYHLGFHNLMFHRRNWDIVFIVCCIAGILLPYGYFFLWFGTEKWFPVNYLFRFGYQEVVPEHPFLMLFSILYMSFSAGFFEEIFFRGFLRLLFQNDFSFNWKYILFSSLLFSLVHWENGIRNLVATFVFGLVFAILYLKLKNIWPLVTAHVVTDIWAFWPH